MSSLSLLLGLLKIATATSKVQMQCALYEWQLWKSSAILDATISHLSKGLIDPNQKGTQEKVQFSGPSTWCDWSCMVASFSFKDHRNKSF